MSQKTVSEKQEADWMAEARQKRLTRGEALEYASYKKILTQEGELSEKGQKRFDELLAKMR